MNQMRLNLPQIDEEATKAKAEKLLDQYRALTVYIFVNLFP
ncbi:hypothetical protein [Bacillus subtilis]|nr:Uncharacterised protein [Bacillus subtilis]